MGCAKMGRAKYVSAFVVLAAALFAISADGAPSYQPSAVFCANPSIKTLCPVIPSNIGNDPPLHLGDYSGVFPKQPDARNDVQSPFDNYSWQLFIALNWPAGTPPKTARQALTGDLGTRVWETWNRVSQVFGPAPGLADCGPTPAGLERFDIGSDTYGRPVGENEEYIQAATGDPVIDVSGNWTIFERRVGNVEVAFLKAPYGHKEWMLTTRAGQANLVTNYNKKPTVFFPVSSDQTNGANGAMEIKAAWRILDPAKHAENIRRFYVRRAFLTVAPDLVRDAKGQPGGKICAQVDLGLVAMHILQKNARIDGLQPQWIWSTFEHVDNAPLAKAPCDPVNPDQCNMDGKYDCPAAIPQAGANYSYFDVNCPECSTNQPPRKSTDKPHFAWSSGAALRAGLSEPHSGRTALRHASIALLVDLRADGLAERAVADGAWPRRFGVCQLHAGRFAMGIYHRRNPSRARLPAEISGEHADRDLPAARRRRLGSFVVHGVPHSGDAAPANRRDQRVFGFQFPAGARSTAGPSAGPARAVAVIHLFSQRRAKPRMPCGRKIMMAMKMTPSGIR